MIEETPPQRSFLQRHRIAVIAAAVAAGVLALGGVGWAVAASNSSPPPAPAVAAPPATSTPPKHKAATNDTIRGTVQTQSGDTWTVRTRAGATFTVTITSKTQFGTKKDPSSAARFPIGAMVVVTGRADDSSITATRISSPSTASDTPTQ
ncbi:DUF5666 domain-containing protein [Dactylosporangium matsuzakiense]|uniref:DUF5666 domain-containing protein n=1 Tax=Dactylosporangium matsuzakiense TaxID=53360 RepID=A0A9W6KXZ7_9ACTN|nr:DUF5666 domain-containing protein [Dactylosporangium matsuzakiense]GLL08764.1 hypothetical protein GCM10017581_105360 [Dactylosporangium matsuzakiense]